MKAVDKLSRIGAVISGVALLLMMLVGAVDVIMSKFFNQPIPGAFESTEAFMVVSAFLAIGYNQVQRGHIAVVILKSRLHGKPAVLLEMITHMASSLFFFLLAWQNWIYGLHSLRVLEYESGLFSFPVYPAKLLAAAGLSLACVQCIVDSAREFLKLVQGERLK